MMGQLPDSDEGLHLGLPDEPVRSIGSELRESGAEGGMGGGGCGHGTWAHNL